MHRQRSPIIDESAYEVVVGHTRVRVIGANHMDAVEKARHRLCLDHPRLWDVIQALELQAFQIHRLKPLP